MEAAISNPTLSGSTISFSPGFQLAQLKKKKKVIIMKQILYISNPIVSLSLSHTHTQNQWVSPHSIASNVFDIGEYLDT